MKFEVQFNAPAFKEAIARLTAISARNSLRPIRESFHEPLTGQTVMGAPHAKRLKEGAARGLSPQAFVGTAIVSVTAKAGSGMRGRFQ
jgi:hypothetical protein